MSLKKQKQNENKHYQWRRPEVLPMTYMTEIELQTVGLGTVIRSDIKDFFHQWVITFVD